MASVPPSFHTVCCMYPTHRPFTDSWCLCESYSASSDGRSSWSVSDTGCTQNACLLWGKRKQKKRTALAVNKNPQLCSCVPGDRPVCVRACRCSSSLRVKRFPQKTQLQTKGLSPVCNLTWALRSDVFLKVFSHPGTWQMCFLLPTSPGLWPEYGGQDRATSNQLIGNSEETDELCCSLSRHTRASKGTCHTHLLSASLQLGHVQAIRLFFSPGWLGSSRVRVWSTWRVGCPGVVASCSPVPCMVWTVRCCWPDKQDTNRPRERERERGHPQSTPMHKVCLVHLGSLLRNVLSSPPVFVMVTGTPWTWTPLMLIVCTAWAVGESCDVFKAIKPPAGAILARVLSFRPLVDVLLVLAGGEAVVVTTEVVGVTVVETESWSWTVCHSPDAVLKII